MPEIEDRGTSPTVREGIIMIARESVITSSRDSCLAP